MKQKTQYKIVRGSLLSALAIGAAISVSAPTVVAQDAQIEEIVVTGSNIRTRRQDFSSPSPIQTVGEKEIADTGAIQFQDIFKGITANSGSTLFQDVTNLQGTSQFSLRGLGVGSTLTLINGRRAGLAPVVDNSGQLFTDANQYPTNAIKSVEVLTDGASATYGSEAVAGVVNVFTRDDFEGFELGFEARDTNNESLQLNGAYGVQGSRGGFAIFANLYTQTSSTRSDFENIADGNLLEDGISGGFDSVTGSPGRFNRAVADASVEGGFAQAGLSVADPDCVAAGGIPEFFDNGDTNCRYHFLDQRRIFPEEDRIQIFATANYDISDAVNIFGEIGWSRNEIRDGVGGLLTRQFTNDGGFLVPADHPFNFFVEDPDNPDNIIFAGPEAFETDPNLEAVDLIFRGRPIGSDGDGDNQEDIDTVFTNTRLVGGFDYQVSDNWLLYGSVVWANSDFTRFQPREWDIPAFADLIVSGAWNPFGTRLTDPTLISPKDGVSVAANSDDVFAQFSGTRFDEALVRQTVFETSISGTTGIQLGGGPVSLAFGAQYRDVLLEDIPDEAFQTGENRLLETVPEVFGEQDVWALFGEANLPITDWLNAQVAVRFEDYGEEEGGDTIDPKIAIKADVSDQVALRGSFGTSFQAPSIRQLAGIVNNGTITDPGPAPGETLGAASEGDNVIVTIITEGGDELTPQSASNVNLGVIYRSNFGLDLAFDAFYYDYDDLIIQDFTAQTVFNLVASGELEPERAIRSVDGQASTAISNFINGGSARLSGFDITAAWRTGPLTFDLKNTLITTFDSSEFGDLRGNRNFNNGFGSTPDLRINGGVTYDFGGAHRVNLTGRFIGAYTDDQANEDQNDRIGSNLTIDLRYDIQLDEFWGGNGTRLSIGAVNLFDELAPQLANRPFIDFEVHDPRGRQVYLSFNQSF